MIGYICLFHVQRAIGGRVSVRYIDAVLSRVLIDGQLIGAYYPGGYVLLSDLLGSHLTDAEIAYIEAQS